MIADECDSPAQIFIVWGMRHEGGGFVAGNLQDVRVSHNVADLEGR